MAQTSKNIRSVEFIVVIVLATVLSAIVLFVLAGYATEAENKTAEAEGRMIRTAIQAYALEQGLTSVSLDDAADLGPIVSAVGALVADDINGPDGSADTKVINSVTIDDEGAVTRLVYISSAGRTLIFDGSTVTVN